MTKFYKKTISRLLLPLVFVLLTNMGALAANEFTVTASGGSTGTQYSTLGAVFTAINAGTHTGTIVIGISATPASAETGPCVLNSSGAGSASYTSLTIRPTADGVVLSGPTATGRGLIELNGADNVTIDGDNLNTSGTNRNLTISNTAASTITYTSVIRVVTSTLVTTANNVVIMNLNINGSAGTANNTSSFTSATTGGTGSSCGIVASSGASTVAATTAPSAMTSNTANTIASGQTMTNFTVSNCNINNCGQAISFRGAATTVCPLLTVINNTIGNPTIGSGSVYWKGISIQGFGTGTIVSGNNIYVESFIQTGPYVTGMEIGIVSSNGIGAIIQKNVIGKVINNNTGGYGATGINIGTTTASANLLIANNFIYGINTYYFNSATSPSFGAKGIKILVAVPGTKIYHNTISLSGNGIGAGSSADMSACICLGNASATVDIRNNILSNTKTGYTGSYDCCIFYTNTLASSTINNNAYYSSTGATNYIACTSGSATYTAANFSAGSTSPSTNLTSYTSTLGSATNDNASIAATTTAPLLTSDFRFDYTVTPTSRFTALIGTGANLSASVAIDYDGTSRPTTPCMGAFEAIPPSAPGNPTATAANCSTGSTISALGLPTSGITWYWQTSATGTSTASVAATSSVATDQTVYATGTYYIRAQNNTSTVWSTTSGSVSVTFPAGPTAPTAPVAGAASPVCISTTLTAPTALSGTTNYWQTSGTGTSTADLADDGTNSYPKTVTTAGSSIYYLNAKDNSTGCWSTASSATVTVYAPGIAITPSPANAATGVCRNISSSGATLSWAAPSSGTAPDNYNVYIGTTSNPTTLVGNTTTTSISLGSLSPLLANTQYYWKVVALKGTCVSVLTSSVWSFTTNSSICYCASTHTSGCGTDYIDAVKVFSPSGGTTTILSNTPTGCSSGSYIYYSPVATTTTCTLTGGQTYDIKLTFGSDGNQYSAIWIDYNNDGTFATTECITTNLNNNPGASGTSTHTFTVPLTATSGTVRMRVIGGNDSQLSTNQACGASSSAYGETEDYDVTIYIPPPPVITSLNTTSACATTGSIVITGTNLSSVTAVTIGGTAASSFVINSATQITATVGAGTTGTVNVSGLLGNSTSSASVTINPSPAAPTCAGTTIALGATASLTASGSTGTFDWYSTSTGGSSLFTGANYNTLPLCSTTTFYVEENNGTCVGARTSVVVTVTPASISTTPANGLICTSGSSVTLNAPSGYTTYAWSGASLNTSSGQTVIATPSTTTQYSVLLDGNCTLTSNVGVLPFGAAATPSVSDANPCFGSNVTLNSGVSAGNFGVASITFGYATMPGSGVTTLASNGTANVTLTSGSLDDGGWGSIPIGFNYNFFGTNFTTLNVGTNGLLQFGTHNSTQIAQYSGFAAFPSASNPSNIIAWMANDLNVGTSPTGSSIKYWTEGLAPTRRFVIQYTNISQYGTAANTQNAQVMLYETTGNVEIHIQDALSNNTKYIGVQNAGTIGATAPGRNGFTSTISTSEAWQFIPPASYTYLWNPTTYLSSSTVTAPVASSVPVSATPYSYTVQVTNPTTGCITTSSPLTFTMHAVPNLPSVTTPVNICGAHVSTLTVTGSFAPTDLIRWYSVATGGTPLQSSTSLSYTTPSLSANTSYWVESYNGSCPSARVQINIVYSAAPTVSISNSNSTANCGAGPFTATLGASSSNALYTYTWVASPNLSTTSGANTTATFTASNSYTVNASDINGCSNSASTSVIVDNPLDIVLVSPADLSTNLSLMTSIAWSNNTSGPAATNYDVYFGTSSTSPAFIGNQATTTYSPGTLQPYTTYYWKIVPKNGTCASVVAPTIYSFTTGDFFTMTTGSITTCSGSFYDTGGSTGTYSLNESSVLTINPGTAGSKVQLTFNSYDVENTYDFIYVYDGTSTSGTLLATLTGTSSSPVSYTSTVASGALTVEFSSDFVTNQAGWDATISCLTACTGTPVAGTIPSSVDVCTGKSTTLNMTALTNYGITYQWESSINGVGSWTTIGGATASSYSTPSSLAANPTYYRCKVICLGGGGSPNFSYSNVCGVTAISCEFNISRTTGIVYSDVSSSATVQHPSWNSTSSDDNFSLPIALPSGFNFTFNGATVTSVRMCTNGWLSLDAANSAVSTLSPSWSANTPYSVVAPLWCDLVAPGNLGTSSLTAGIWYDVQGTAPNRVAIFQWKGMEKFSFAGPDLNFQVRLYESSVRTNHKIEIIYGTMIGYNGSGQGTSSFSYGTGLKSASVSATPQTGEIYVLQNVNTNRFTTTSTTHNSVPECNTKYAFTPGNSYVAPAAPAVAPPSNDDPTGAVSLSLNNGPCVDLCGKYASTKTATATGNTVCSASIQANADDDVWYSITLPNTPTIGSTGIGINVYGGYGFKARFEIWDASLTSAIACATATAAGNTASGLYAYGSSAGQLTSGNTYFVRIYHDAVGFGGTDGQFAICAYENFPPPVNDDPCGAYALTSSTGTACSLVNYTSVAATQSITTTSPVVTVPGATCAFINDDDVWFTYTANNPTATIYVQGNTTYDPIVELYTASGTCGTSLTLTASSAFASSCNNTTGAGGLETVNLTGMTAGVTKIYVRVYHKLAGFGSGSFGICVLSNTPPANDNCSGATSLAFGTSCNPTTSTSAYGTLSQAVSSGCSSSNPDDDVWFTVTRPAASNSMNIVVTGSSNYDPAFEVFTGSCGSLTSLGCTNANSSTSSASESRLFTNLSAATTTYKIRVYHAGAGFGSGTFNICVYSGIAPANVTPCNSPNASANVANVNGLPTVYIAYDNGSGLYAGYNNNLVASNPPKGPSLVYFTGNTAYAYAPSGLPAPTCGSVATTRAPVWYKLRIPTFSAGVTIRSVASYGQTMVPILSAFVLTGGTICSNPVFTQIGCSSTGILALSSTTLSSYNGQYIYVQLEGPSSIPTGNYTISVQGVVNGITLTNPTTTSMRVNFPSFSAPAPTKYAVYWRKVGATGISYVTISPTSNYTIQNLTSNSTYEVWVRYADNVTGGSQIYGPMSSLATTAGCGGNLASPTVTSVAGFCSKAYVNWTSVTAQGVPSNLVPAASTYPYRLSYSYTNGTGYHGVIYTLGTLPAGGQLVTGIPVGITSTFGYTFKCVGGAIMTSYTTAYNCTGSPRTTNEHHEYVINGVHYVDMDEESIMNALAASITDESEMHEFHLVDIANQDATSDEATTTTGTMELTPNPTTGAVAVSYSLPSSNVELAVIRVMDVQGKVIRENKLSNPTQYGTVNFDLNEVEAGVYLVNIQAEGYTETKKLVVSK